MTTKDAFEALRRVLKDAAGRGDVDDLATVLGVIDCAEQVFTDISDMAGSLRRIAEAIEDANALEAAKQQVQLSLLVEPPP